MRINEKSNNIKTVEEFNNFCMELKDNFYQEYNNDMKNITIPYIIENLARNIDIQNKLNKWEEIIRLLYYHFVDDFIIDTLDKLYNYYPSYPIECVFELVLSSEPYNDYFPPFWYRTVDKIYNQFYIEKVDKEIFDKYLLFAYDDSRYFIALLYKNNFDIPDNSIYTNIEKLLKKRFAYDALIRFETVDEVLARHGLLIENIKKINIDRFSMYSYAHPTYYPLIGIQRSGDIGYCDKDGIVHILETTFLKSAIFETDDFQKAKKKNSILKPSSYNFHDFLIYQWGVVKYFQYIYKYGNYQEYSKLYNEFVVLLEKEAKESNNTIAIEKLSKINKIFNQKIIEIYPDEIEETLLEGAKKQIVVNAYERNPKARQECINKYGFNCFICGFNFQKNYGEIGKDFIHVHHLKPLSEIQQEYEVNPIQDLRPVCPNCHAMLHRKIPAYSIKEIQNILKGQKK